MAESAAKPAADGDAVRTGAITPGDLVEEPVLGLGSGEGQSGRTGRESTVTPLDGAEFLAANRRSRDEIRERADARAAKRARGAVGAPRTIIVRRAVVVVGAVLLVALAAATAALAYLYVTDDGEAPPAAASDSEVLAAAKSYTEQVLTYQPGAYDELDKRIRNVSTSAFAQDYIAASKETRQGNDAAQATMKSTAGEAGIVSLAQNKAVVLVAVDRKLSSPQLPSLAETGDVQSWRVRVTLARQGERWLLDGLEPI